MFLIIYCCSYCLSTQGSANNKKMLKKFFFFIINMLQGILLKMAVKFSKKYEVLAQFGTLIALGLVQYFFKVRAV